MFYTITLFNLVVPTCSVWQVILFQETAVVNRIKYTFSYFFLLVLFTHFILDKKSALYQVKKNISLKLQSLTSLSYATAFSLDC